MPPLGPSCDVTYNITNIANNNRITFDAPLFIVSYSTLTGVIIVEVRTRALLIKKEVYDEVNNDSHSSTLNKSLRKLKRRQIE